MAYSFPFESGIISFIFSLYKSLLFAAIPNEYPFSPLAFFANSNHLFNELNDSLSIIEYTNIIIFAFFANVCVKLLYFSCPAVSHILNVYSLLLISF